jgi:hypothetical protein
MVTEETVLVSAKAQSPICFTVSGITTSPPGPMYPVNTPSSSIMNCGSPGW